MELHRLLHELQIQLLLSLSPHSSNFISAIAMLTFAFAFVVVGVVRLVEWQGIGFSNLKRYLFCMLQVLGCLSAGLGFAIFAIDPHDLHKTLLSILIGAGFALLFPIQIYLALVRRVRTGTN